MATVDLGKVVGPQGPQGPQGIQGPAGKDFSIAKIYSSISAMNSGYSSDGVPSGGFVMINTGSVEDEDTGKLYCKGSSSYTYITDLSGATGIQGPQGPKGDTGAKGDSPTFEIDSNGHLIAIYSSTSSADLGAVTGDTGATINPYPVGSIYLSVNNTNPGTLFGGTWVQIKDTFLLAAGSTYTAGKTGGTAGNTLTYNNLPPRTVVSTKNTGSSAASIGFVASNATNLEANRYGDVALQDTTNKTDLSANYGTGGQDKLNNMPPYLAVYVWKRTA